VSREKPLTDLLLHQGVENRPGSGKVFSRVQVHSPGKTLPQISKHLWNFHVGCHTQAAVLVQSQQVLNKENTQLEISCISQISNLYSQNCIICITLKLHYI
jgi:hypothetical protein